MSRKFLVPLVLPADPAAAMEAATKQYVDTMNEVAIAASDPGAAFELWYDTGDPGLSYPNVGRGWVAHGQNTVSQVVTAVATYVDLTLLTATWTADPTRRYLTTVFCNVQKITAAGEAYVAIADGANVLQQQSACTLPIGAYGVPAVAKIESGLSGVQTRKARAYVTTNGGNYTGGSLIIVEDVGGV